MNNIGLIFLIINEKETQIYKWLIAMSDISSHANVF